MKIDDIINNSFTNKFISRRKSRNNDNVDIDDFEQFIDFIKESTSEKMYNNIFVTGLFDTENGKPLCRDNTILDKFKVIMFSNNGINIAKMTLKDYTLSNDNTSIGFNDIKKIKIEVIETDRDISKSTYKMNILDSNDETMNIGTDKVIDVKIQEMNEFMFGLKKAFDNYKNN